MVHCVRWREKLRKGIGHWKNVMMLTMTLDPADYDGPEDAYRTIAKKRSVAEMIKELHRRGLIKSREYTLTTEFHKNGWPHYHVLIQANFLCKHKLQEVWHKGHCWYSKHDFDDVSHAINYATKYISKGDGDEPLSFPDWVLDYNGVIRRFATSRGLCETRKVKKPKGEKKRPAAPRRTGRMIQTQCGKTTKLIEKHTLTRQVERDGETVEVKTVRYRLRGVLEKPWDQAEKASVDALLARLRIQEWNAKQNVVEIASEIHQIVAKPERQQKLTVRRYVQRVPSNQ